MNKSIVGTILIPLTTTLTSDKIDQFRKLRLRHILLAKLLIILLITIYEDTRIHDNKSIILCWFLFHIPLFFDLWNDIIIRFY